MSQQINLFNPIFLKQKKYFSALTLVQGLTLILVGAIVMAIYARLQLAGLENEVAATSSQLTLTRGQLARVTADYTPKEKSKELEEEIQRTEAELQAQQQAYDIVQQGGVGNTKGYSEYMRAFSRQALNGLWLTGFNIVGAGTEIELRGRALQPGLIPAYINRLRTEPIMKGKSFSALSMEMPDAELNEKTGKSDAGLPPKLRAITGFIEFNLRSSDENPEHANSGKVKNFPRSVISGAKD